MPSTVDQRVPGSIAGVPEVAAMVMAGTGLLTIAECFYLGAGRELWVLLGAFAIPTLGTTLVAKYLAEQKGGRAAAAFAVWFGSHALLAGLVGLASGSSSSHDEVGLIIGCALVASTITATLAAPAFIAAAVYGQRRDLEAGDAFLGFAGIWFLLLQGGAAVMLGPQWAVSVPGLIACVVVFAIYVQRTLVRRSFSERAARGELDGWRVRAVRADDDVAALPPLFGSSDDATAILERLEAGFTAYRSAVIGLPVARVGGAAARLAETPRL
jgi:FtsH-binding integral membrane protein